MTTVRNGAGDYYIFRQGDFESLAPMPWMPGTADERAVIVEQWHLPAEDYRADMTSAVIAQQVAAGGHDTEGTRAEAERWLAMVCGCVCDGMRATTADSVYRIAPRDNVFPRPLGKP